MKHSFKIKGSHAVRLAARDRLKIFHRVSGGDVTISWQEARGEDPASVYVIVQKDGWWDGTQRVSEIRGYSVHDYFNSSGMYLGPDDDGVEPTWNNA